MIQNTVESPAAPAGRPSGGLVHQAGVVALMLPASSITLVVQGLTEGLVRLAPKNAMLGNASNARRREVGLVAVGNHRWAVAVIQSVVFMYRHSLQNWWLHRGIRSRCRFIPSCTEYAVRAVDKYGFWTGLRLIGDRFGRCNPTFEGDYVDFP